jgi:MFS transporter, DHA2 family, multidrug resistance protein
VRDRRHGAAIARPDHRQRGAALYASGVLLMFMVGIFIVSSLALMTPWLQVLSNYPVETAGLIMAPRGFGSLVTTMLTGRLAVRIVRGS